jgi:hypothetical protein
MALERLLSPPRSAVPGHRRPRIFRLLLAALATGLAGCGAQAATHRTTVDAWTGLGAKLSDWQLAHPKGRGDAASGCVADGCYGPMLRVDGAPTHQFTMLSTTRSPARRVDRFELAIGDGRTIAEAKRAVLSLLPNDARSTAFWVLRQSSRESRLGSNSCAMWNIDSHRLGQAFAEGGRAAPAGAGRVGVILFTAGPDNLPLYTPTDVSRAIVSNEALSRDATC